MKKLFSFIILVLSFNISFGQEPANNPKTIVYKFHPVDLSTSSLVFGRESFNTAKTRSTVLSVGVRYKNVRDLNNSGLTTTNVEEFNKWTGVSFTVERRIFVPKFGNTKEGSEHLGNEWGIYFSPSLKVDRNVNRVQGGYNGFRESSRAFTGIKPSINIGIEFTIFKNLYMDAYVGGGIRFLSKSPLSSDYNQNNQFLGESFLIKTIVNAEGVRPNGGLTFGLKL
jgi:hypothetical protein